MSRRAASAIEFALLIPALLLLLSATVDYGWYFPQRIALVNATSQGAMAAAATDPNEGDPVAVGIATAEMVWAKTGHDSNPTFTGEISGSPPDVLVSIDGTGGYAPLIGFALTPAGMTWTATFRMHEQ